jgi:hypothetical protein
MTATPHEHATAMGMSQSSHKNGCRTNLRARKRSAIATNETIIIATATLWISGPLFCSSENSGSLMRTILGGSERNDARCARYQSVIEVGKARTVGGAQEIGDAQAWEARSLAFLSGCSGSLGVSAI